MVAPILKGPMLKKEMSGDLHPLISLEINRLWRVLELGAGPVKNLLDCWREATRLSNREEDVAQPSRPRPTIALLLVERNSNFKFTATDLLLGSRLFLWLGHAHR